MKKIEVNLESKNLIVRSEFWRGKLIITSIKLLIPAILLIITTVAWFIGQGRVSIGHLDASTKVANDVEISIDNGVTWSNIAYFNMNEDCVLYKEATGDSINLYQANLRNNDGSPQNFIPATKDQAYFEYKVLFRSLLPATIYLEEKSDVYPAAGKDPIYLINSNKVVRESPDGNFSEDLIAGAVRVAFIEDDLVNGEFVEQSAPKYIWAPNKGYQIKNENGQYIGYLNSVEQQLYKYTKVVDYNNFYITDATNIVEDIHASYNTHASGNDIPLTHIDNLSTNTYENIKAITIRVWIEGNDREAIYSLKGGQFKINLSFLGLSNQL